MNTVEVITKYEPKKPTLYSFDGGDTWLTKQEYKQRIRKAKKAKS